MALLTFKTTNIFYRYTFALTRLNFFVVFLKNAIVIIVCELYLRLAVTVDTPAHRQRSRLMHLIHFMNVAVALLTLHLPYFYVLGVIEINVIREVMDLCPGNRR